MYERHFGMTSSPFRLTVDPSVFFPGVQHNEILTALHEVFDNRLPTVLISGEIGTGKTTLLRTWIDALRAAGIEAALLVTTQLDREQLLWSISSAFGCERAFDEFSDPLFVLAHKFQSLKGGRIALIVDEAQNIDPEGFAALAELAALAKSGDAELRICVAGQPEFLKTLLEPAAAIFGRTIERVFQLGRLNGPDTRSYIEHRLLAARWRGVPVFEPASFDAIHRLTGGVPRRINVLCNRLLLTSSLRSGAPIDEAAVQVAVKSLEAELDSGAAEYQGLAAAARTSALPDYSKLGRHAVLVLAEGRSDHIKAAALIPQLLKCRAGCAALVSLSDPAEWEISSELLEGQRVVHQALARSTDVVPSLMHISTRFKLLVEQCQPAALVVFDGGVATRTCAELGHSFGISLIHIGAGPQSHERESVRETSRAAIGQISDLSFECGPELLGRLPRPGSVALGNPLIDSIRLAMQQSLREPNPSPGTTRHTQSSLELRGYGVIALTRSLETEPFPNQNEVAEILRAVSRDLPLIWPARRGVLSQKGKKAFRRRLDGYRVACIEELNYVDLIDFFLDATCIITDSPEVIEEAAALRIPCLSLVPHVGQSPTQRLSGIEIGFSATRATRAVLGLLFGGADDSALPEGWDGHATDRIARHIVHHLFEDPGVRRSTGSVVN